MGTNLTPKAGKVAAKLGVTAEQMDAFNECLVQFQADVKANCPDFRMLGMFIGVPNFEGDYGVLLALGPNVSYERFAEITKEMGQWMTKFEVQ